MILHSAFSISRINWHIGTFAQIIFAWAREDLELSVSVLANAFRTRFIMLFALEGGGLAKLGCHHVT